MPSAGVWGSVTIAGAATEAEAGGATATGLQGWAGPALAGAIAGEAGLVVFLVAHAVWIVPIWSIATVGVIVAALGGAAAGWALDELRPALPEHPVAAWVAVVAGAAVVLSPTLLVGALGVVLPVPVVDGAIPPVPPGDLPRIVAQFAVELVVLPMLVGSLLGWVVLRTRRAAVATATAGFVFAVGPGHNNPFFFRFMGLDGALFGVALLFAIVATSSAVLVGLDRLFRAAREA